MFLINAELARIVLLLLPFTLVLAVVFIWKALPMFLEFRRGSISSTRFFRRTSQESES